MRVGIDGSRLETKSATGVERYSFLLIPPLVRELVSRRHSVSVYVRERLTRHLEGARVRPLRMPRLWTHLALGPAAIADRIECLFVPSHVLPILRPRRCAVVLHDACMEDTPQSYTHVQRWYLRVTTAEALRSATVLTHSVAARDALAAYFHAPPASIAVIPPAAPPVGLGATTLPWPKPFLLYIGRIEERKNVGTLIAAFDQLLAASPELPHRLVVLGGDGVGAGRIRARHALLWTPHRVIFHGYASDALRDAALRAASGLVLPSVCEGSSFVLLEARTARVPFASGGHAACREAGGSHGIYVAEVGAVEAWVRALEELIRRPIAPEPPAERTWEDVAREVADVLTIDGELAKPMAKA